jgi:hypothetical protein
MKPEPVIQEGNGDEKTSAAVESVPLAWKYCRQRAPKSYTTTSRVLLVLRMKTRNDRCAYKCRVLVL